MLARTIPRPLARGCTHPAPVARVPTRVVTDNTRMPYGCHTPNIRGIGGKIGPHTITPPAAASALAPRSARRLRASRSMQAIRTATPISTCS